MCQCGRADTVASIWEKTLEGLVPRRSEKGQRDEELVYEPPSSIPNSLTVGGGGILNHALLLNDSNNEWKSFYNTTVATDPPLLGLTLSEGS